jgi:3-oxoadipate enol-lactonase
MKAIINGIVINYDVSGPETTPAVVLHHPLATSLGTWDALTATLNKTYRVIRFDARGHGSSAAPPGPYSFETLSADVIAVMDHVGVKKAHFLGLSMGGMIGQYLGLLHPARFHSLTLVSTSSATPAAGQALWDERIKNSIELGMASVVDGAMARWVAPSVLSGNPALVQRLKTMITDTPAPGYAGWCGAIRHLNVTASDQAADAGCGRGARSGHPARRRGGDPRPDRRVETGDHAGRLAHAAGRRTRRLRRHRRAVPGQREGVIWGCLYQ